MRGLLAVLLLVCLVASACSAGSGKGEGKTGSDESHGARNGETVIVLSDDGVTVNGQEASDSPSEAVHVGADIVYYEAGRGSEYGEGDEEDGHSAEEAARHTVVTIAQPGTYRVTGEMSAGQIAVDLGEDAVTDPAAVVRLILDNVSLTSTVAPAVMFYNVFEPYSASEDTGGNVDLSGAGAQVVLADGSVNHIRGAYVARIYEEGTTSTLHKYDGAFYSKMSMNISGEEKGTGELYIEAANEGLNSELHLAINGGSLYIYAQDDGINTNEDGISVTQINGGYVHINAGLGAEGDGIDSNGYLTINGGTIIAMANERSPDGGIDADKDITINGGTLLAFGRQNSQVSASSAQPVMQLIFAASQEAGSEISLRNADGYELLNTEAGKAFSALTFSSKDLAVGTEYFLYVNGVRQQFVGSFTGGGAGGPGGEFGGGFGGGGGMGPEGQPPEPPGGMALPDGAASPEGMTPPNGTNSPWGMIPPDGWTPPDGTNADGVPADRPQPAEGENGRPPKPPGGFVPPDGFGPGRAAAGGEGSASFLMEDKVQSFFGITAASAATETSEPFAARSL
jgi:hypothetical protein